MMFTVTTLVLASMGYAISYGCMDPPNLERRRLQLYSANHESRFLVPMSTIGHVVHTSNSNVTGRHVYGRTHCPRHTVHNGTFDERALCPWYFTETTDERRSPRTIVQVTCRCENCVLYNNGGHRTRNTCQPLLYHSWVLRRNDTCDEFGYYDYREVLEPIRVGCVCVPTRVKESRVRLPSIGSPL